jgi:hypothetical protein
LIEAIRYLTPLCTFRMKEEVKEGEFEQTAQTSNVQIGTHAKESTSNVALKTEPIGTTEEPAEDEKKTALIHIKTDGETEPSPSFVSPSALSVRSGDSSIDLERVHREPGYAEICSFLNVFSALLSLQPIPFTKIEKMFCTFENGKVDRELIDLHITLMRKIYLKSARADRWEAAIAKFCSLCPSLENEKLQLLVSTWVAKQRRAYRGLVTS